LIDLGIGTLPDLEMLSCRRGAKSRRGDLASLSRVSGYGVQHVHCMFKPPHASSRPQPGPIRDCNAMNARAMAVVRRPRYNSAID
jgi:hypothetical protein